MKPSDLSQFSDQDILTIVSSDVEAELKKRGYAYGWYKEQPFVGVIYILVNPAFSDMVKIGYADDVEKRLKSLNSNSGLPDPYHCHAVYKVKKRLDDLRLHGLIDTLDPSLRHSKKREFYEMSADKALEILSAIAQINGDEDQLIVNPLHDPWFSAQKTGETVAKHKPDSAPQKSPVSGISRKAPLRFINLGITPGSKLQYIGNPEISCTTFDDQNKVSYEGKIYSLSRLARVLRHSKAEQGGVWFSYNGERLTDLRERLGV